MVADKIANMKVGKPNCLNSSNSGISQSKAASMLNVSRSTVQAAKFVAEHSPDLADKVMRGAKAFATGFSMRTPGKREMFNLFLVAYKLH